MKLKELRKASAEELAVQLREARFELAKARAASEIGTAKNPGRIRAVRKTIAKILTIQNEIGKIKKQAKITGETKTAPVRLQIAAPEKSKSAVRIQKSAKEVQK